MSAPLAALFLREWRIARRVGGSGAMGVVFFLTLVDHRALRGRARSQSPCPHRPGDLVDRGAAREPPRLRPAVPGRRRGRFARSAASSRDAAGARGSRQMRGPLGGDRPAARRCRAFSGSHAAAGGDARFSASPRRSSSATPALTLIGAIGAAATVTVRRGGLLMALLVLPLTIPVLIFGVSASQAASGERVPFFSPFSILCAITPRCGGALPLRRRRGAAQSG